MYCNGVAGQAFSQWEAPLRQPIEYKRSLKTFMLFYPYQQIKTVCERLEELWALQDAETGSQGRDRAAIA